jgi:thiamine-phosphate pyrophosphorylase
VTAPRHRLPRLHVVTDDGVLARPDFEALAGAVLAAGPALALHLRGPGTPARTLLSLARRLRPVATETGAVLLVNDRIDVALAARLDGVHLGARSLPVGAARDLLPPASLVGASVRGSGPAREASAEGPDYLVLGTIYPTPTHPDRPGDGPEAVGRVVAAVDVPVLAIGGVTPDRVAECLAAGAHGVAVLGGVWSAPDPWAAVVGYLERVASVAARTA